MDSSGYSSGSEATFSSRLRLHSTEPEGSHPECQVSHTKVSDMASLLRAGSVEDPDLVGSVSSFCCLIDP